MNSPRPISSLHTSIRQLAGFLLALVLIVTGCNLPGKSETPTQLFTETTDTASPLPTPTPVDPVLARSLDDALSDGVQNGAWTLEESILTGLRFLTGEVTADDVFGDTPIMSTEGTGVIIAAQRYIYEGTDEKARVEMQRYLDMLMPSPEILEKISRPAQQTNSSVHLARVLNLQDEINCQEHWRNSFSTPSPEAVICLLRTERTVRNTNIRLYYPSYWTADDPRRIKMDAIMEGASESVALYNGYGSEPIHTVYIVMTDLELYDYDPIISTERYFPTVYAAAYDPDSDIISAPPLRLNCRLGLFPRAIEQSPERLKQVIAHEMFHCYQFTNLREKIFNVRAAVNKWWAESTATFFSGVVYPTTNMEFMFNNSFRVRAKDLSLFGMSYENYLFFQYLAREGGLGTEGIINILRSMPEDGDIFEQSEALANVSNINEMFHNFNRAYVDRRLTDWGGGVIPIEPVFNETQYIFEGDNEHLFNPMLFKLGMYKVTFEDQTKFSNFAHEEGESGQYHIRPAMFVGAWQTMPARINTVCDPTEYILVVTRTNLLGSDPYQVTVNATGVHQETDICDECLHGTWELDNDSDYYFMYTLVGTIINMLPSFGLDTSGGETWLDNVSGQMLISFNEDNVASGTQSDYSWTVTGIDYDHPDRPISMVSTFNGGGTANYTLQETPEEEKWIFFNNGEFDISQQITFMDRPVTTVPTGGSNTTIFLSSPVRYECNEDTLLYTTLPDIGTLIFFRVGPPSGSP
jgi:hypothetical protein